MLIHTPTHTWLKQLHVSYVPGPSSALSERFAKEVMDHLHIDGHVTQEMPSLATNVILTTAKWGEVLSWRQSLLFTARHKFNLEHSPTIFTIVHVSPEQLRKSLADIEQILAGNMEKAGEFAGISESAYETLYQQGDRGGALLYLERILQIQVKCIRILLVVGNDQPEYAYLFDLVGAHPRIVFENTDTFYKDIITRIATAASTQEITEHQVVEPEIRNDVWMNLSTVNEMITASREFGKRNFFTEMIQIANLAKIPGFSDAISQQYSEGCFSTWDTELNGLVTTITGSARPVKKESITDKDLAVVVGVKQEYDGALIKKIEAHPNHPPSSEAVEMIGMDLKLPRIRLQRGAEVPVIRSKLHGHRGVQSFDKTLIEYVPLAENYLYYPVSCSTDAQYHAVQEAFSRSSALQNPDDPRQVVFTVLPGHGMIVVEKWMEGKQAFQLIWEAMDNKAIEISNYIPQGPFEFKADGQRYVVSGDTSRSVVFHHRE